MSTKRTSNRAVVTGLIAAGLTAAGAAVVATQLNQARKESLKRSLRKRIGRLTDRRNLGLGEPQLIARGWDNYAKKWKTDAFESSGLKPQHLGDEWTEEDAYGLPKETINRFADFLQEGLLDPHLPAHATTGLEIGPGGGRLTSLLLRRTDHLHVAEPSAAMLAHLRNRLGDRPNIEYHHTDGFSLPTLPEASLDFVIAFDVFVHFEPRLVFWYLRQIAPLLKPGATGVIHYANVLTPLGWKRFEGAVFPNLMQRQRFAAFGVMCPEMMGQFLKQLGLEVVTTDTGLIPRDAVAVFRKPTDQA